MSNFASLSFHSVDRVALRVKDELAESNGAYMITVTIWYSTMTSLSA